MERAVQDVYSIREDEYATVFVGEARQINRYHVYDLTVLGGTTVLLLQKSREILLRIQGFRLTSVSSLDAP